MNPPATHLAACRATLSAIALATAHAQRRLARREAIPGPGRRRKPRPQAPPPAHPVLPPDT